MTLIQQIITIGTAVLGTVTTRALPFLVFSSKKPTPKYIRYLGKALPLAVFAMLVIYCLKNVSFLSGTHGIPELLGILLTGAVHVWKRNMFLSILVGTAFYMVLIRLI